MPSVRGSRSAPVGARKRVRRALIVEGGAVHVLAAARCLSRSGWEVGVATTGADPEPSRAVSRGYRVPEPEESADAFVREVARIVATDRYDVVFGADDIEVLLLSARRAEIPCVVPYGDHDDVTRAIDKLELSRAAARVGLASPVTEPVTPARLLEVAGPVMVKARLHWDPAAGGGSRHLLAELCADRAEAELAAKTMEAAGGGPVLQEVIDGELMALTVVRDRGGALVGVVQQRSPRLSARRTSCRAETVPVDHALLTRVEQLLADLRWWGLANLQFIRPLGGEPHLIDLNGRFYGSLALAVASGVPLPDLWGRVALGEAVEPVGPARVGVRFQSLLAYLRVTPRRAATDGEPGSWTSSGWPASPCRASATAGGRRGCAGPGRTSSRTAGCSMRSWTSGSATAGTASRSGCCATATPAPTCRCCCAWTPPPPRRPSRATSDPMCCGR